MVDLIGMVVLILYDGFCLVFVDVWICIFFVVIVNWKIFFEYYVCFLGVCGVVVFYFQIGCLQL